MTQSVAGAGNEVAGKAEWPQTRGAAGAGMRTANGACLNCWEPLAGEWFLPAPGFLGLVTEGQVQSSAPGDRFPRNPAAFERGVIQLGGLDVEIERGGLRRHAPERWVWPLASSGRSCNAVPQAASQARKKGAEDVSSAPQSVPSGRAYLPPFLAFSSSALARLARSALPTAPATLVSGSTSFGALAPA